MSDDRPLTSRLAPSPTGRIHAGTIFAALQAWLLAKSTGGEVVLRIEDLDPERSKASFTEAVMRDYEALGISWDRGPFFQHDRADAYRAAFEKLEADGLIYPCFCTRADLRALSAPHRGEHSVYDGRCAHLDEEEVARRTSALAEEGRGPAARIRVPDETVVFDDIYQGSCSSKLAEDCGDFIVRRSDGGFAYQLAVVVDDAEQGVDLVARGFDLLPSTPQQVFLHEALGLDVPHYAHFPLFCAPDGRRLAKRNHDASFDELVERYGSPEAVLGHIAFIGGLQGADEPATPESLLATFDATQLARSYEGRISIGFDCA